MTDIVAGVVIYNPDSDRLKLCLNALSEQVSRIYIFDNSETPCPPEGIDVVYLTERKNRGMAYALNRIMEKAQSDGYGWVILMDQDSIIPPGMVRGFYEAIQRRNGVGIICPQVIDKRRIYLEEAPGDDEVYVDFCITSASCTSVEAWEKCGKFDEWLFIDLVDNDFCKRLVLTGYRILRLNRWVLDQEFGRIVPKSRRKQEFWLRVSRIFHNQNFAKFSYKKYVSPLRVYYTNRNIIYLNRKMRKYGRIGYENYNCKGYPGFIVSFMLPSILRAQRKWKVFIATIKGIRDGVKAKPVLFDLPEDK